MDRKGHILMHAHIAPPDAQSVRVARLVRPGAFLALQSPFRSLMIEFHRRHHLALSLLTLLTQLPAAHVMRTGDDSRSNAFRHPGAHDVVTNLSFDSQQIPSAYAEACGVVGMNPKWI